MTRTVPPSSLYSHAGATPQSTEPGLIAISARPGYGPGAEFSLRREAIDSCIADSRAAGIASIIRLLAYNQLPFCQHAPPAGLVTHYEASGFAVAHIPSPDGLAEPHTTAELGHAWHECRHCPSRC